MQSILAIFFLGLIALASATATDVVLARVVQEQAMGKAYTDIMMKMTHGTHGMQAANLLGYGMILAMQGEEKNIDNGDLLEKTLLKGVLAAWNENKVARYMTVLGSEDVQKDYYYDRLVQLQMQSLGAQIPPQLYSLVYMKFYLTYLKTMKFALHYQLLAHFDTLYEDEIDVLTAVVSKGEYYDLVSKAEESPRVKNKLWTFSTFSTLAQTDLTTFYLQFYLDYMTMALSGQQQGFSDMWSRMFSLYQKMYAYSGSQSGLRAFVIEKQLITQNPDSKHAAAQRKLARMSFLNFTHCYRIGSQIDYVLAIYQMYAMYVPYMMQQAPPAPATTTPTTTIPLVV